MIENNNDQKESEFFFNLIKCRYGDRFKPKELEEIRKGVEEITKTAEALRKIKLNNYDEPFFVFKPFLREK